MGKRSNGFGTALSAVRAALGLSQDVFGARLGVTRRTLTRWECHDELPPVAQRKHIATSFSDAPAELRAALVRSLDLGDDFVAALSGARPAAPAGPPALEGAFVELCESVDATPRPMRAALIEFLRRAEASGLSVEAIRAELEQRTPKKARRA